MPTSTPKMWIPFVCKHLCDVIYASIPACSKFTLKFTVGELQKHFQIFKNDWLGLGIGSLAFWKQVCFFLFISVSFATNVFVHVSLYVCIAVSNFYSNSNR